MAKRIKITEQQLSVVINHLKENESKGLIEEGFKEWMLVGLMTLGSAAGIKAQDGAVSPDHIKAAKMVQSKLDSGDKEMVKYFDEADIELNRENLTKLLRVDNDRIDTFKTKYLGTAKAKLDQGYALKKINITKDTTISELPKGSSIDTIISVDLSGNLFDVGKFTLNQGTVSELSETLKLIEMNGGRINSITIESSTDKQRISPQLEPKLVQAFGKGGNEGLSNLRNNKVKEYLVSVGVDDSLIKQDVKWEQGAGEVGAETPQDPSARYVRVIIDVSYDVAGLPPDSTVIDVVESVYYVLIKKGEKHGTKKNKGGGSKSSSSKKGSGCKIDLGKIGSLKCPKKF